MTDMLSSTWAICHELSFYGVSDITPDIVFGLGASAWYRFEMRQADSNVSVLRFAHAARMSRALSALNICAPCFNILTAEAHEYLWDALVDGGRAIIVVDGACLQGLSEEEQGAYSFPVDYAVVVTEVMKEPTMLRLCGPWSGGERIVTHDELHKCWFFHRGDVSSATLMLHKIREVRWDVEAALRFALSRYATQMQSNHSGLGGTGLRALQCLMKRLEAGDERVLMTTARCASCDGGLSLCRDQQAAFLRKAGELLGEDVYLDLAEEMECCALLWQGLMGDVLRGASCHEAAPGIIEQVFQRETSVVDVIAQLSRNGALCNA